MIKFKKTSTIDTALLAPKLGEGFIFKDYSVLNNGNVLMIFEKKISESETRYVIKVHTRVGLQRQCSFTAVDSFLENAFLYHGELFAYLATSDISKDISLARLEPDTKEDLVPIEKGKVESFASKEKDFFVLGYQDGRVIKYERGKAEILAEEGKEKAFVSFDCNERLMWKDSARGLIVRQMISKREEYRAELEGVECFMISRDDRSAFFFKDGKVFSLDKASEDGEIIFKNEKETEIAGERCKMNKSTLAVYDGQIITVGTI